MHALQAALAALGDIPAPHPDFGNAPSKLRDAPGVFSNLAFAFLFALCGLFIVVSTIVIVVSSNASNPAWNHRGKVMLVWSVAAPAVVLVAVAVGNWLVGNF